MFEKSVKAIRPILLAVVAAGSIVVYTSHAQSPQDQQKNVVPAVKPASTMTPYRNHPDRLANRERALYQAVWGIDDLNIKTVESGVILRFSYRVVDPGKAIVLNDKKLNPVLESPEKGVRLVIPTMDKVGQLRQAPHTVEAGKSYWMAFSNSGRLVKPGDRVDIVIGNFRARGLLVE